MNNEKKKYILHQAVFLYLIINPVRKNKRIEVNLSIYDFVHKCNFY